VKHFVSKFAHQMKKDIEIVPCDLMGLLDNIVGAGNIREGEIVAGRSLCKNSFVLANVLTVNQ
jgi:hypothetical protein